MKKIYLFFILICLCSFSLFSFSKNKNVCIKGYITSFGNEPFSFIGINSVDDKEYGIIAEKEIMEELKKMGGTLIEFEGIFVEVDDGNILFNLKDGIFEVLDWKVVKKTTIK